MAQAVRLSPEELARRQAARPSIVPQVSTPAPQQAVRTPAATAATTQAQIDAKVSDIAARSAATQQNAAAARGAGYPTARGIEVAEQAAPKPATIQQPARIPAASAGPARFPSAAGIEVSEGAAAAQNATKAQNAINGITNFGKSALNSGAGRFVTSAATKVGSAIAKAAPVAAAVGGIAGGWGDGLHTDTQDYYRRLGIDPPSNDGILALGKDLGVRTLGVLSDVGAQTVKGITFGAYDPSENFADKRDAARTAAAQQVVASSPTPISNKPSIATPKPGELPGQTIVPTTAADTGVPDIKAVAPTTPTPGGRKVYTNVPDSEESKQLASGRNLISIVPSAAAAAGAAGAGSNPAGQPGAGGGARRGGGIDRDGQLRDWREREVLDLAKKTAADRASELKRLVGASEAALASGKRKTAAIYANLAGNYSGQGGGVDLSGFARAGQAGQTEAQRMTDEANARAAEAQATQAELATAQQQRVAALMDQYNSAQDDASRSKIADQIQALTGSKTKPSVVDIATGETDLEGRPVTVKGLADSNGNIIYSPIQPKKQQ